MRTPQWYKNKIKDVRRKKRELSDTENGSLYEGKILDNKKRKEVKEDLKREKRAAKRGEKQDMRKEINEEIQWSRK